MTNREWLLNKMQNMSDEELAKEIRGEFDICEKQRELDRCCIFGDCDCCFSDWLKAEHKEKITLSEAERIILENMDENYKIVGKTENGTLFAQKENGMMYHFDVFNGQIFAFMETGHFYYISELLKGE